MSRMLYAILTWQALLTFAAAVVSSGNAVDLAAARKGQANLVRQLMQARHSGPIMTAASSSLRDLQQVDANDTDTATSFPLSEEECDAYCPCESDTNTTTSASTSSSEARIKLRFLNFEPGGEWLEPIARDFEASQRNNVEIEFVYSDIAGSADEALNEAKSQLGFYDGFFTFPSLAGEVLQYQGWADLTDYVTKFGRSEEWTDILLGYRQYIAQYQDRILMFPLDGDSFSMFYRTDVLEAFNLTVPRTWPEYIHVAQQTHGKVFENKTLSGSCLGRAPYCTSAYYAINMLASMTQMQGAWQGFMFDTDDMAPLLGRAMEQAMEWQEQTVNVGSPNEFASCIEENKYQMNSGHCTLTINWGNSFKGYLDDGDFLRGRLGVAPTPGSTHVLDRETGELVPCTKSLCKYATYYEDVDAYVNAPPYLAFGGFSCAVNNYTDNRAKQAATEFCAFTSSTQQSIQGIIPPAGSSLDNGQDPFRLSHLDVERYVEQGYERDVTEMFLNTVRESIESDNVVVDDKFPVATSILFTTDYLVHTYLAEYLEQSINQTISPEDQAAKRKDFVAMLTDTLVGTIEEYDGLPTTQTPTLEAYQKLRGVYNPAINLNQITTSIRAYGYALLAIIMATCCFFAGWAILQRTDRIVRASQPLFLVMICAGALIFGFAIVPLGIDDSNWTEEGAGKACMTVPWLLAIGFTTAFAALYSKISRINIVFKNASKFRRVQVTEKDVLLPFGILIVANTILLLIWTFVDPLKWTRISTGEYSSYGTCAPSKGMPTMVLGSLLACLNGIALVLANIEAFKSRRVDTEFSESSSIAVAMGFILQIVLVGVPTLFLVDDNPTASYFVRCSIVFVIAMSLLLLIFVPKIVAWWKQRYGKPEVMESNRGSSAMTDPSSSRRGSQFGLKMKFYESMKTEALQFDFQEKVDKLEAILREQGLDADDLFHKAGLRGPSDYASSGNTTGGVNDNPSSGATNGAIETLPVIDEAN